MELGTCPTFKAQIPVSSQNKAEVIYFNRPDKQVICLSTQLSCAVGCKFCASPCSTEKTVNLQVEDMVNQVEYMMQNYVQDREKVILISFMGEGEPLLNFNNVVASMGRMEDQYKDLNIKFSLSTSGAAPDKLAALGLIPFTVPFKLQVSMHTLNPQIRRWFMPQVKSVMDVKNALNVYHNLKPDAPVDLNYVLIDRLNDTNDDLYYITSMFPDEHIKISKYNSVGDRDVFESPSEEHTKWFVDRLRQAGMSVEYHETDGSSIGAACGQTKGRNENKRG